MNYLKFKGFHPDENGSSTIYVNGNYIKGDWIKSSNISLSSTSDICLGVPVIASEGESHNLIPVISETLCGLAYKKENDVEELYVTDDGNEIYTNDVIAVYKKDSIFPDAVGVVRFGEIPNGYGLHVGFYIDWHPAGNSYRNDLAFWVEYKEKNTVVELCGTVFDRKYFMPTNYIKN